MSDGSSLDSEESSSREEPGRGCLGPPKGLRDKVCAADGGPGVTVHTDWEIQGGGCANPVPEGDLTNDDSTSQMPWNEMDLTHADRELNRKPTWEREKARLREKAPWPVVVFMLCPEGGLTNDQRNKGEGIGPLGHQGWSFPDSLDPMSQMSPGDKAAVPSTWRGRNTFLKRFYFYLFLERGEGREKERERNTNVWVPFMRPLLGTWPATQACALTGNRSGDPLVWTSNPLVCRPALNPLSHTSQSDKTHVKDLFYSWEVDFPTPTRARESVMKATPGTARVMQECHQRETKWRKGFVPWLGIQPATFQL